MSNRDRSDLTVLVPCFDAGVHLSPLLESLRAQTKSDLRIVVVDDRSTDDSVAVARAHPGIEVIVNEHRLGIGGNWNRCTNLVDTEFFALAHMDDVYEPEWASKSIARLRGQAAAGAVHSRARAIDELGEFIDSPRERYKLRAWRHAPHCDRAATYRRLLQSNFVAAPSVVWRTAAFREFAGFDASLRFALDWKALFELLLAGHELAAVDEPLVRYRRHTASATHHLGDVTQRTREEIAVATFARERGIAAGLLEIGTPVSTAARDLALVDVVDDLRSGQRERARTRMRFLREELGLYRRDGVVRAVSALLSLGRVGEWCLRVAFRAFVALRAPRSSVSGSRCRPVA
ncbi:MAG: glycosyltransferase family 2 protein [Planctomycetota bacterium]